VVKTELIYAHRAENEQSNSLSTALMSRSEVKLTRSPVETNLN